MNKHSVEYTDTFGGEANYSWARRHIITMPELTHYGYDGATGYSKARKAYDRQLMRKAKAACGLTGMRGKIENWGNIRAFYPANTCTVLLICDAGSEVQL